MPSDSNFGFSVLIAGLPVPEYHHEGKVYVESNLWTPVSYNQRVRELAYGEVGSESSYKISTVYSLEKCRSHTFDQIETTAWEIQII